MAQLLEYVDPSEAPSWAAKLINAFGSLSGVLAASPAARGRIVGAGRAADLLTTVREVQLHALELEAFAGPVLASSMAVVDFLRAEMAHLPVEQVRVLYLDARHRLLRQTVVGIGSMDEAPIYPREVLREALEVGAVGVVLVHNHPSGDPAVSRGDRAATAELWSALNCFDIRFHDHLIIARGGHTSLREIGLL